MPRPIVTPSFERTVLPSGVRVLTESIPSVRSISVGAWVDAGSRDEAPPENGLTHFIEHVVFKGTRRRRGYQINQRMEAVGGYLNAFTAKEHTCYYARGLDEHLGRALDTVLDLVTAPALPEREIEKEKDVVVEEIKMVADTPDDLVFDLFDDAMYPGHALGRPVLGTPETVRSFSRAGIERYMSRLYTPDRLVVTVAGHARHADVVRAVERLLAGFDRAPSSAVRADAPAPYVASERVEARPIQQAHLVVGTRVPGAHDPRRTALAVLNTILGGGMSSRLHQNIREKYGWCYAVYSFLNVQDDSADLGVYIGTDGARVDRARTLIVREMRRLADEAVSPRTLDRAKQQLKGSVVLGLESMSNRMQRLGRVELTYGREIPIEEAIAEVEAVTIADVQDVAQAIFADGRLSATALVPNGEAPDDADD